MARIEPTTGWPTGAPAYPRPRRRRANGLGLRLALSWLALVSLLAVCADWLPLADPTRQSLLDMLAPPDRQRWFGADSLGRDVFSRTIHGLRITLTVALSSVALALAAGSTLGICAGFFGGAIDRTILMGTNVLLAFPPLVLVIAMIAYPGQPVLKVIVALAIVFTPSIARIARVGTRRLVGRAFIVAARAAGMGDARIIVRELLPNLVPMLLSYSLLLVAVAALAEAALSFLGLGVAPPTPTLGAMMASEQSRVLEAPHAVFFPAALLFLTILALNLAGERLQRRIDGRGDPA